MKTSPLSKRFVGAAVAVSALALGTTVALAGSHSGLKIHTGGKTGSYHSKFCPVLKKVLDKAQFKYTCSTSQGSLDNLQKVADEPRDIGFSQLDVFALAVGKREGAPNPYKTIRTDLARECLFMVTRDKELSNFGEISALASEIDFVLPPAKSGSAATFRFLQDIDDSGLGDAGNVTNAASTDDAIRQALSADRTVALFVQFADAGNKRFKDVTKGGGQFIPVLSRKILRQRVNNEKVYYADETQVANASWSKTGKKVVTACTPMVLFTGSPAEIGTDSGEKEQNDLIQTLQAKKKEELTPKKSFFSKIWNLTKEVSSVAVEKTLKATESAREKAGPMLEEAKVKAAEYREKAAEWAEKAKEASGPALDRAKEKAAEWSEKAKEVTREAVDKVRENVGNN